MASAQGSALKILLDTNVVSQTVKLQPNPAVARWWEQQEEFSLMLSAITFQELRFGIALLPEGKKREQLQLWLEVRLQREFAGRVLAITHEIADMSGRLLASARKASHTADPADTLIAATALVHRLQIATLNRKHFEKLGVDLISF